MDPIIIGYSPVYPQPFLVGLPLLPLVLFVLWRRKKTAAYLGAFALFWFYLLVVINLTLFPTFGIDPSTLPYRIARANFIPFYYGELSMLNPRIILYELVGNLLLTVPLGFLLPFVVNIPPRRIFWLALGAGTAIETAQLLLTQGFHSTDINDLILNAAGVLIGFALFRFLTQFKRGPA